MPVDPQLLQGDVAGLVDTWFQGEDGGLSQLQANLQLVRLPANTDVFHRGDLCSNYLVVIDGCVRVQALSAGGREVVLYRVTRGQSCVITTSCLLSQDLYPAEGVTDVDTTALVVPREVFDELLTRSDAFRRFVFSNQGQRLSDLIQRVGDIAFNRIDVRLARLLLTRGVDGQGLVTATHQQLANELGTAREVISRQLKVFEKQGWIKVQRGTVALLQPDELARVTKDAY